MRKVVASTLMLLAAAPALFADQLNVLDASSFGTAIFSTDFGMKAWGAYAVSAPLGQDPHVDAFFWLTSSQETVYSSATAYSYVISTTFLITDEDWIGALHLCCFAGLTNYGLVEDASRTSTQPIVSGFENGLQILWPNNGNITSSGVFLPGEVVTFYAQSERPPQPSACCGGMFYGENAENSTVSDSVGIITPIPPALVPEAPGFLLTILVILCILLLRSGKLKRLWAFLTRPWRNRGAPAEPDLPENPWGW